MGERRYAIYDVFTKEALAGNPLAVVLDAQGLDDAAMQAIAREFNLSETVFVLPAQEPVHTAAIRIFTPAHELPFAGHPTVGTAVALSHERSGDGEMSIVVLEERVGAVRCVVSRHGGAAFAEFDLPRLPRALDFEIDREAIAAALGLGPHEIGFENHRPGLWSAGVPYVTVLVAGLEAAARAALDPRAWLELVPDVEGVPADPYVYCRETVNHDCAFHSRMFAPGSDIPEDPATGSAAAAFAGSLALHDQPTAGSHLFWIEQGIEMGGPSRIRLEVEMAAGAMSAARIGGHAVRVAEGTLMP